MQYSFVVLWYQCFRGPCCPHLKGEMASIQVRVTLQLTITQSVLASILSGTHDHMLVVVRTVAVFSWSVLPVERTGLSCNRSQFLSLSINIYLFWVVFIYLFFYLFICVSCTECLWTHQACQPRLCSSYYA